MYTLRIFWYKWNPYFELALCIRDIAPTPSLAILPADGLHPGLLIASSLTSPACCWPLWHIPLAVGLYPWHLRPAAGLHSWHLQPAAGPPSLTFPARCRPIHRPPISEVLFIWFFKMFCKAQEWSCVHKNIVVFQKIFHWTKSKPIFISIKK